MSLNSSVQTMILIEESNQSDLLRQQLALQQRIYKDNLRAAWWDSLSKSEKIAVNKKRKRNKLIKNILGWSFVVGFNLWFFLY